MFDLHEILETWSNYRKENFLLEEECCEAIVIACWKRRVETYWRDWRSENGATYGNFNGLCSYLCSDDVFKNFFFSACNEERKKALEKDLEKIKDKLEVFFSVQEESKRSSLARRSNVSEKKLSKEDSDLIKERVSFLKKEWMDRAKKGFFDCLYEFDWLKIKKDISFLQKKLEEKKEREKKIIENRNNEKKKESSEWTKKYNNVLMNQVVFDQLRLEHQEHAVFLADCEELLHSECVEEESLWCEEKRKKIVDARVKISNVSSEGRKTEQLSDLNSLKKKKK